MKLEQLSDKISKQENGIFYSVETSKISYPEEGNVNCHQLEDGSFWFKHRNEVICTCVKKYSPNADFFDIGGGNGFVAKSLQNEGINVCLVEPGEKGALAAHQRGLNHVICSTLEDVGFKKNSLESVGFFDVMEHIEDDKAFLKNISDYLKPNGFLYMTVPAFQFLWSADDEYAGHFRRYTLASLKKMFTLHGYEIKFSTYIFSFLVPPVFMFRTIPSKLGIIQDPASSEKQQNDHNKDSGIISSLMKKTFQWEIEKIQKGERIHIGSSCFLVAQKKR